MAQNISLLGADYPDVPAVQLPKTGGGMATFYDINVVDNLNSESSTDALSAKQGKVLAKRGQIIEDTVIEGASTQYTIPARTAVLIMARCNANQANTSPEIIITANTQTAKNQGSAGGSCFCYMVYGTGNTDEQITVAFNNYTSGGTYNQYGRVSIIALNTY